MINKLALLLILKVFTCNAQVKVVFETPYDASVKALIFEELSKYPKEMVKFYVDSVVVENTKKRCGQAHAFFKYFMLSTNCDEKRVTVHHEMSSMLLIRYDMKIDKNYGQNLMNQFYALNGSYKYNIDNSPSDFKPGDPKADFYYKRNYATTNFENDFNVISESLWSEGKKIVELMLKYPDKPVSKKIKLVLDFYQRLDSTFTMEFFRHQNI